MTAAEIRRRQCLLSLGALLLLLGLVAAAVLLPWWSQMRIYEERIEELTDRWQRFQNMNARRPLLEARLKQINQRHQTNNYTIEAATPAVAAANLQKAVKQAVESSGGQLVSTQNLPQVMEEGHARIAIRVRMNSDMGVLAEVLHNLEGGRPLLFVENLTIRARKAYRRRGVKKVRQQGLDIKFELSGYLREDAR